MNFLKQNVFCLLKREKSFFENVTFLPCGLMMREMLHHKVQVLIEVFQTQVPYI